jgi:hypothetical protein
MTDLLTKVKWALRAHRENFALDEDLEHLSLDMAQALIAEVERREKVEAENAVLREMQGLPPTGTYPEGELKRRMKAEVESRERIERAAQWVLNNPIAHPENVRAVLSKAMGD